MSKYDNLWIYVSKNEKDNFKLAFDEIEKIAGVPVDHSFLTYKKELSEYGWKVGKISMKEKTIEFTREDNDYKK